MAQDQNNSQPSFSNPQDALAFLHSLLTQPAPSEAQAPNNAFMNVGGMMLPMSMMGTPSGAAPTIDPKQDAQTLESFKPALSSGPYQSTPQGEAETSKEYQNRLNSPYMMFGADNRFAQAHPRMAGMMDNMFLGGSLVGQAHEHSLAEGGGVEGAGGAISDVMNGIMGMPQARMQYRQNLEQMPLEYQSKEAQLEAQRADIATKTAQGVSALENNPARIAAMVMRGQNAEAIRAAQAQAVAEMKAKVAAALQATKLVSAGSIQDKKGKTAVTVANINANAKRDAASIISNYKPGSPEDKFFKAQGARRDSALYGKMNGKQQADIRNALAMKYIQSGGDPIQAKTYAASQVNQWDQGVQNLFGQYSKLSPAEQQSMDFETFAQKHGVDLNHLKRATQPQQAPSNNNDPLGLGIHP